MDAIFRACDTGRNLKSSLRGMFVRTIFGAMSMQEYPHRQHGDSVNKLKHRILLNAVVISEKKSVKGRTAWQFCLLLKSRGVLAKPTHVNMFVSFFALLFLDAISDRPFFAFVFLVCVSLLRSSFLRRI